MILTQLLNFFVLHINTEYLFYCSVIYIYIHILFIYVKKTQKNILFLFSKTIVRYKSFSSECINRKYVIFDFFKKIDEYAYKQK